MNIRGLALGWLAVGNRCGFVHSVIPTLTTAYPHPLAAVSLVRRGSVRKLGATVERGEGHWRQSRFKPESRKDPRRGRGQRQAALAQGRNPRPAVSGQRLSRAGDRNCARGSSPVGAKQAAFGWRVAAKTAPARERGTVRGRSRKPGGFRLRYGRSANSERRSKASLNNDSRVRDRDDTSHP